MVIDIVDCFIILKSCLIELVPVIEQRHETTGFAYAKTKTQISFAVTAKLICAIVFAIRIEKSLYFLNRKFQTSSHLLWLYSLVCVKPGRNPRRPVFLQRGSYVTLNKAFLSGMHCTIFLTDRWLNESGRILEVEHTSV